MPAPSKAAAGELHLQFTLGDDRYALPASQVVEVLPLRRLKQVPEAPLWVAGLFEHRGRVTPVIDLSRRVLGRAAQSRSSTRVVLVRFDLQLGEQSPVLGLILEQATDTLRLPREAFKASGLEAGQADYLGPLQRDARGMIQRIEVAGLLDDEMRALLFQPADQG
ncbi:chemotaxis protein CheW [Pseudomonas sp. NY15364]|uniref:chemotaxis protein CheW n=1 Tax=Pseudomonas sp. NY15364 TaxID=3400353 RepID=UPI0025E21420|nr:chemotaxis protein CheW [uncultured Pseudomonas sp.]